jgi:asparagine synthase (glutamine-hydrolysing)
VCGIAVILPGSALETPPHAVDRMTAAVVHRGPDARACVRLPGCELGHTRLSIIDIEGGAQPMADGSGQLHVVFNGEIYNHRELRRDLEQRGAIFRTRSDTEVLLQAFEHWGEGMLKRLNGQFAFAIWNSKQQELFVARDRFGEKPLYWAAAPGGQLLFASEIKSILASELISPRIDLASAEAYLGLYYVPPDRTIYDNVNVLPPGHAIRIKDGVLETRRWWSPGFSNNDIDEVEAIEQIQSLMASAVQRQTIADVPIGAFLSGGLDSTSIVALMSRSASERVRTYAVGFGDLIDELPFARDASRQYATDHHELQMDIDVPAMLSQMVNVYDEPFGDSSNIPTYLVAQFARQHVKVVLSGDGGDEIFGGYAWYRSLLGHNDAGDRFDRHLKSATVLSDDRRRLWGDRKPPNALSLISAAYTPAAQIQELDRATSFDIACYLAGDILVKVDRAAMAHGLETRAPFLDVDLAEFVLGLPWQMRFKNGSLKCLLRQASGHLWPESIRSREKQGFGAPVRNWLEKPEVSALWSRVTRNDSALSALMPGVPQHATELRPQRRWSLLCLGLWLEGRESCLAGLS